jgi:XTP/dITP diphosphohydrolase
VTALLVATTNPGKLREIRGILAGAPVELVSLEQFPAVAEPEETGETFGENARLKALYYAAATGLTAVADDSGLEIDALDKAPGVYAVTRLQLRSAEDARLRWRSACGRWWR